MKLIGLTGGIGMGKSTSAAILRERGIPLVDTDELARRIVEPGEPAVEEIRAAFGDSVIDAAGRLRRETLAFLVFSSEDRRRQLEDILHPRIRALWQAEVQAWRAAGAECGVVVIPLLHETGAEGAFDWIVCAASSEATQGRRLLRRGWSEEECARRIAAQWPVSRKMDRARHVIWTEGDISAHARQWQLILEGEIPGIWNRPFTGNQRLAQG